MNTIKITGEPAIINTTFHMHFKPIVCLPKDASHAFKEGSIDILAIENFIVERQ